MDAWAVKLRLRTLATSLGLACGLLIGVATALGGSSAQTSTVTNIPSPFLVPTGLPAGTSLVYSSLITQPEGGNDLDLFYRLPVGSMLHVWQTTRAPEQLGPKNPLSLPGATHRGSLATWLEGTGFSGSVTTLTARIGAVLVEVDAPMSASRLLSIADSLR
jgi:hypothetical protein